jgi:hypothetical protein
MSLPAPKTAAPSADDVIDVTDSPSTLATLDHVLRAWVEGIRNHHVAHWGAAARYEHRGRLLGAAAVMLSTLVGTAIFASLVQSSQPWVEVAAGGLSVLAVIAGTLQTALGYPQLAERHRTAAMKFGDLRRVLDELGTEGATGVRHRLADVRQRWQEAEASAPPLPPRLRQRILRRAGVRPDLTRPVTAREEPAP